MCVCVCVCVCVFIYKLLDFASAGFGFRMKSVLFLPLLLCLSPAVSQVEDGVRSGLDGVKSGLDGVRSGLDGVRSEADVPPELPVLWDELWGLKQLVLSLKAAEVQQRQVLRSMESRLRDGELEAEQQKHSLDALEKTAAQQGEELRDSKVKVEADEKLLMELNSDLRRRVKELEEQSAGGWLL